MNIHYNNPKCSLSLTIVVMYTGVFFVILYLIFLYYKYFNAKGKKSSLPTNWPVLGMMPALILNRGRVHQYATELLEQSGGTFLFKGPWFTNMDMLVTSDPTNVHYILSKNFHNFQKGPQFKKMFDILGDGIFIAETESWENQRKIAMPLIKHMSFQKFVADTSWNKVEDGLIPVLDLVSKMGIEVDLQELFQRFAFDCSCIMVLGHDPISLCEELPHLPHEKAFANVEEAIWQRHVLPESIWKLQKWLQIGKEKKLMESKEILYNFLSNCISLKQKDQVVTYSEQDFDLLSSYMRTISEKGNAPNHMEEVWRDTMLNLIFAGKDTISATLTWFFWLLSKYPEKEKKIRQELLINEDGKWKFSHMDELKKLNYLHAALCEALRLFPPIAFQHKAPLEHDRLPSGHEININEKTLLCFYAMGRMESMWGKDCLEFKPERWFTKIGNIKSEPSFKFTAFNAGPRSCLGKDMSFIQLKIVAAAVINRFHVRLVEGHMISPSDSVVLHMKHGLKVKVSNYI